ncbi:MAG: hypothetical protein WCE75_12255 [Terracidiphilus sp.]
MSNVNVKDNSTLSLNFPATPDSAMMKYLRSSDPINVELNEKQPASGALSAFVPCGLSFASPVTLGTTSDELTIKSGLQGSASLKNGVLFDPDKDDFGDSVTVPNGKAYLSVGIAATVDAGLTEKSGDLKFGLNATSSATITNYRLCDTSEAIDGAMQAVFQDFLIPADLQDIGGMAPGLIATVEGSGSLKFSFKATYPVFSNPLATVTSGPLNGFNANVGASLGLGVSGGLTGGYQLRVRRLDQNKFELSYEKKRGSSLTVAAQAQVGASVTLGSLDIIETLLKAVSKDPTIDKDTFGKQTGLSESEIDALAAAIKAGIDRTVTASISDELDFSQATTAAFSYQIDIDALEDNGRAAVNGALSGDLTEIEGGDFAGIGRIRSVFASMRESRHILKVNLLGAYNFGSVTDLIRNGHLVVDPDTGTINILDKVSASKVGFTSDNFARDGAKLRAVVAAGVTMTAAYTVGGAVSQPPNFTCGCWAFESHQKTALANVEKYLHETTALRLLTPGDAAAKLKLLVGVPRDKLGRSTFLMESSYQAAAFRQMFLTGPATGTPRPRADYEQIGRNAQCSLLSPDDPTDVERNRVLTDDTLWTALAKPGATPEIARILEQHGITSLTVKDAIIHDVVLIEWWAASMAEMAQAVVRLTEYLKGNPIPDPVNNTFKKLRSSLDDAMASVARNTQDEFGGPWGLLVMAEASGLNDKTTVTVVSPYLSFTSSRP